MNRTDRIINAFKNINGVGPQLLTDLLKVFSIYYPPLGYLQGMNDLFVPIIYAYIPEWSEDSMPLIKKNGEYSKLDIKPLIPKIFWCFEAMLRNINQIELLSNITEFCRQQAELIHQLLCKVSPIAGIWIKRAGLKELLWVYGDFVLLFKRTFDEVWPTWIQMNCSPIPSRWLIYFMCSIIVASFDSIASIRDSTVANMMNAFPKILSSLSRKKVSQIALWLVEQEPLKPVAHDEPVVKKQFKFFKPKWNS